MATSRKVAGLAAAGLTFAAGAAVLHAQDRPESLLPPGFDQPAPPPPPAQAPPAGDRGAPRDGSRDANRDQAVPPPPPPAGGTPAPDLPPGNDSAPDNTIAPEPPRYQLPDYARRSLDRVGVGTADGLPADAFGRADGRFVQTLMRRIDAPLPSRWLSIALRRTLASSLDTPAQINGADFAAERAWLLVRMGEAQAARAVVQGVDPDNATPKLMQVTMQASLAAGDPAGLCGYADTGAARTGESGWVLARAMCLALGGEPAQAGAAIGAARRRGLGRGIDLSLAEKVVGAGAQGRRAVTIEWAGVDRLTTWRWGLAAATGVEVPEDMMTTAGPQVRYWRALSPMYAASVRAADADLAAAQGVLSNLALIDLYGAVDEDEGDGGSAAAAGVARDLRDAYVGATAAERITALKALWSDPGTGPDAAQRRYGRLVLTARAATGIRPRAEVEESDRIVASLLTAGFDRQAARWAGVVKAGSDGWAMIALGNPAGTMLRYGDVEDYAGGALKQRLLFAGLAGLGRLSADDIARGAEDLGIALDRRDPWSRAIDAAARADQPGTVVLLCAAGMQARDWRGIDPAMLFRMTAALRATGLDGYARMIAAEAIARLPA